MNSELIKEKQEELKNLGFEIVEAEIEKGKKSPQEKENMKSMYVQYLEKYDELRDLGGLDGTVLEIVCVMLLENPYLFADKKELVSAEKLIEDFESAQNNIDPKEFNDIVLKEADNRFRSRAISESILSGTRNVYNTESCKFADYIENKARELGWDCKYSVQNDEANRLCKSILYGEYRKNRKGLYDIDKKTVLSKLITLLETNLQIFVEDNKRVESRDAIYAILGILNDKNAEKYKKYMDKYPKPLKAITDIFIDLIKNNGYGSCMAWLCVAVLEAIILDVDGSKGSDIIYYCLRECLLIEWQNKYAEKLSQQINNDDIIMFMGVSYISDFWDYYYKAFAGFIPDDEFMPKYNEYKAQKNVEELTFLTDFSNIYRESLNLKNREEWLRENENKARQYCLLYVKKNKEKELSNNYRFYYPLIVADYPSFIYMLPLCSDSKIVLHELKLLKETGEESGVAKMLFLRIVNYHLYKNAYEEALIREKDSIDESIWYEIAKYCEDTAKEYGWNTRYIDNDIVYERKKNNPIYQNNEEYIKALETIDNEKCYNSIFAYLLNLIETWVPAHPEIKCKNALYAFAAIGKKDKSEKDKEYVAMYPNFNDIVNEVVQDFIDNDGYNTYAAWLYVLLLLTFDNYKNKKENETIALNILTECVRLGEKGKKISEKERLIFLAFSKVMGFEELYEKIYGGKKPLNLQ